MSAAHATPPNDDLSPDPLARGGASEENDTTAQIERVRDDLAGLVGHHFDACERRRSGERDLRTPAFDDYMRTCIKHHISCAIGICPSGYAHATDCGYVIDSYIAAHKYARLRKHESKVWLPGSGQIALYIVYNDKNRFIHKLGIHHVEDGKYRIIQGMRGRLDAFSTLTHAPTHTYAGMDDAKLSAFFAHQRRYGLPYNLHGYSSREEVGRLCRDMQLCARDEADPVLVFGGYTPGRITTILHAPPSTGAA